MKHLQKFNENSVKTFQVPVKFNILIQDIGPNPTASDIISCWNDCIEDNPIMYYHEGSNKFILEDGESTPEDVFICLNDYLMGDEDVYEGRTEKVSKKDEIEDFIGKNKKNKSSYEMYKVLREKGYGERDLKDYFYDNY